jgi:hypothetical protein
MRALALLSLALFLAAPLATAHGGGHGFVQANLAGPYLVTANAGRNLTVAESPTVFQFRVEDAVKRALVPNLTLTLDVRPKGGAPIATDLPASPDANATYPHRLAYAFPANGTYVLDVRLAPDNLTVAFTIDVYPASPYRVDALPAAEYYEGVESVVEFNVTDWPSGRPHPGAKDATALVEEWTLDHGRKLGEATAPVADAGGGRYMLRYRFPHDGMYHVYFVSPSLGIAPYATPMAHVLARPGEEAPKAPFPPPFLALGAALLLAASRKR